MTTTEDLATYEENVKDALDDVEKYLKEAKTRSGRAKLDMVDRTKESIKYAVSIIRTYDLELRAAKLREEPEYVEKLDAYKKVVEDAKEEISSLEKSELIQGNARFKSIDIMSVDEKIDTALELQHEDMRLLEEANSLMLEARDIGLNTMDKLSEQNEQLDNALDDVHKINSDLDIAKKEIRVISKKIMTDKIIKAGLVVSIFIILAVVILLLVKPKAKKVIEAFDKKNTTEAVLYNL